MDGPPPDIRSGPPVPPSRSPFALMALAMMVLLALSLWVRYERAEALVARHMVESSYRHRLALTDMLADLRQAESAQRGFVITANPAFLAPYAPARRSIGVKWKELDAAYAGDAPQRARMNALKAVIAGKFAEMDEVIRRRNVVGLGPAITRVSDERGLWLMVQASMIVATAVAAEDAMLAGRTVHARQRTRTVDLAFWTLAGFAAFATIVALAAVAKGSAARYRTEMRSYEAHTRLQAIFENSSDGILIFGPEGELEMANETAVTLLGYTREALAARDATEIAGIAQGQGDFPARIGLVDGILKQPMRADRLARHRDGHAIPVDIALGLMTLPDGPHIIASLRDISERKTAERLKDEFISTVSHELRTPLTSVVGALGLLRGLAGGDLPDNARRLVEIAESNSQRLIRLINDMLDIDRIGSGRTTMNIREINLTPLLRDVLEDAKGLAGIRGIEMALKAPDGDLMVTGDADRLTQVMGNLLSNAIRFSPRQGTVTLSLVRLDGQASICVQDQGPGVAPDFRDRIFSRFAQSGAGAAIPGGTGLGLAISREIIQAHGGEIWFEDVEGGGARFCVSLPVSVDRPPPALRSGRILLVEDDAEAVVVLRGMIEAEGYAVETCGSAREAQAMARQGRYDCVVLDLRLPDAGGLAAVRALRAFPETRTLPIVVVSATARDGARDPAALALDVIDWIDKPVDVQRLVGALRLAMRRSSVMRPTLLHIDDDTDMLEVTAMALAGRGLMLSATTLADARTILAERTPDIVILDLALPDGSGLDLLPALFTADGAAIPTIIYSASDLMPDVARQFDAVLVKSRRSLVTLSEAIGRILAKG